MPYTFDLFQEMDQLRKEINHAFEGRGYGRWPFPFTRWSFVPAQAHRGYPLLNVNEDEDAIYVEALAPGVDPE